MDKLIPRPSTDILTNPSTSIGNSIPEHSLLSKEHLLLSATIKIERDMIANYSIRVEKTNRTDTGILIFGSVIDGNVSSSRGQSLITFDNVQYTNFNFMKGEVYNKDGRFGKFHVMIQLNFSDAQKTALSFDEKKWFEDRKQPKQLKDNSTK